MDTSILVEFSEESKQILKELQDILNKMEGDKTSAENENLVGFSQRIDRIMGAAQTIAIMFPFNPGLKEIGKIAALCKAMGYKAVKTDAPELMPLFCAFWADSVEALSEIIENLEDANEIDRIVQEFVPIVRKRLEWLDSKIKADPNASASIGDGKKEDINDLLNALFK